MVNVVLQANHREYFKISKIHKNNSFIACMINTERPEFLPYATRCRKPEIFKTRVYCKNSIYLRKSILNKKTKIIFHVFKISNFVVLRAKINFSHGVFF